VVDRGYGAASAFARARIIYWSYFGICVVGRELAGEELNPLLDALAELADAANRRNG
jgi:hypothetical protein